MSLAREGEGGGGDLNVGGVKTGEEGHVQKILLVICDDNHWGGYLFHRRVTMGHSG